jgi:glutamine synthetase
MAMIESKHRATSDPESRKQVLKEIEKQKVEYVLFWFTDLEGHLKSFAITPQEIETALDDGMGFDGSSITGLTRSRSRTWSRSPTPTPSGSCRRARARRSWAG